VGDDGVVYFGDNIGMVHAVQSDGTHFWGQNVGHAVRSAGAITASGQVVFGLDDGTLIGLASSSKQLAAGQWPKYMGTAGQSGRR
jgi:outer membrane protein assembly factor BamB